MMTMIHTMQMTFYWGKDVTILFDFWHVETVVLYIVSLLVVFVFSALHQLLASLRSAFQSGSTLQSGKGSAVSSLEPDLDGGAYRAQRKSCVRKAVEALLFAINVGLGYLLMLAAMSFNGGVFLAIVAGFATGHFLFRHGAGSDGDIACGTM